MSLKTVSMRRIVVAADSFKGSLSSLEVAEAFASGFYRVFPHCEVAKVAVQMVTRARWRRLFRRWAERG